MGIDKRDMVQTDSKGKVLREAKRDKNKPLERYSWWSEEDETEQAREIAATLKLIEQHNSAHMEQLTVSTRLYGNTSAFSLVGSAFTRASSVAPSPSAQRISFNLCASVGDTLSAQRAKEKIVPVFITSGGRWGLQRKAENLSKFLKGVFYETNFQEMRVQAFLDGYVWGDGFVHPFRTHDDRVGIERVLPHELFVDNVEAMVSGQVRQKHRVKVVDRDVLLEMFQDDKEATAKIKDAQPANMQEYAGSQTAADLVTVSESYHLRSSEEAKDGRKVIALEDKILLNDPWEHDYFPFPRFQYARRMLGYFGQGGVERLQNLQGEINRLMILVQKSMWLGGSFKVLLENGSKVVSQHVNNEVGALIHYTGTAPQYITPPLIQQEIYPWIDGLIEKGFRQEGVSQMDAASVKPLGLNSGKALREFDRVAEDRQLWLGQKLEAFGIETGHQCIDVVKDIYKDKKSYKTIWPGVNLMEQIDWKDVALDREEYVLKAFPKSTLPDEPSARAETIEEYMQAGLISPRGGRRLLRTEDIEMADNLANAAEDLICKTIEAMLYDKDEPLPPDGTWDLQLARQIGLQYRNFALLNECPQENVDLLDTWLGFLDEAQGLIAPPAPMDATASPQANPQATPTSNMVPNGAQPAGPQGLPQ